MTDCKSPKKSELLKIRIPHPARAAFTEKVRVVSPVVAIVLMAWTVAAAAADYALIGASVTAPTTPGWMLVSSDAHGARFENRTASTLDALEARAVVTPVLDSADAFFAYAEKWKEADLGRWQMMSLHFNDRGEFKNVPCVEYDGLFKSPADSGGNATIRTFGYLCRHPGIPGTAIDVSLARTADEDQMPKASQAAGYDFIDSLTFNSIAQ